MLLTSDADSEVRELAETTLRRIPSESIGRFIARSDVPAELRDFFVGRGIPVAATSSSDAAEPLVDEDDTEYGPEATTEPEKAATIQRLASMTVPQKVKAAMKGTREMRAILIRDPNKLVALSVLSSPKLSETEVESYARMGSVSEDVLRTIGHTRAWIKNYGVVHALVKNPKTPVAMSLNLFNRLTEADVRRLSTDRNIPEPLRIAARKKLVMGVVLIAAFFAPSLMAQRSVSLASATFITRGDASKMPRLTSPEAGVRFDIDGDGDLEQVAWTEPGANVALLARDVNGDGRVTSGRELFGNHMFPDAGNGAAALARALEQTGAGLSGAVQHGHALYDEILLWVDANHDGVSEPRELRPARELCTAIGLGYTDEDSHDTHGNRIRFKGWAELRTDGPEQGRAAHPSEQQPRLRHYYDVVLAVR